MLLCTSRNGNRHEKNETLPMKSASEVRSPSVTLQERQQLKEDINRLTGEQLGRLVKLIYAQEPSLDSSLQNIEIDIEKVRPATLRAMQSFMCATLKKSNQNDGNSESGPRRLGLPLSANTHCNASHL